MRRRFTRLGLVGLSLIALAAVGASPAAAKSKNKTVTLSTCVSTAIGIPDHLTAANSPGVAASIPVTVPKFRGKPQNGVVTAISSVGVRITHTFDSDLTILLVNPAGQVITLANHRGSNGAGYGTGAASCAGSLVTFADTAALSIVTPGNVPPAPITGTFKPETALASLVGGVAKGNWTLFVIDGAGGDVGTLNAFALNLTYQFKTNKK